MTGLRRDNLLIGRYGGADSFRRKHFEFKTGLFYTFTFAILDDDPAHQLGCALPIVRAKTNLRAGKEYRPFFLSLGVFLMGYIGIAVSMWPWLVPFEVSFRQAAAAGPSQSLLLVGTVIMLPVVLGYTGYCYYIFRGKASDDPTY